MLTFANANNTSDRGFGGGPGRGFWGGANGLNASKMIGANYNYELKNKFKFNTSLRWNHSDGDVWSSRSSENFMGSSSSFSNSLSQSFCPMEVTIGLVPDIGRKSIICRRKSLLWEN